MSVGGGGVSASGVWAQAAAMTSRKRAKMERSMAKLHGLENCLEASDASSDKTDFMSSTTRLRSAFYGDDVHHENLFYSRSHK
jgi:hypothetical protein